MRISRLLRKQPSRLNPSTFFFIEKGMEVRSIQEKKLTDEEIFSSLWKFYLIFHRVMHLFYLFNLLMGMSRLHVELMKIFSLLLTCNWKTVAATI